MNKFDKVYKQITEGIEGTKTSYAVRYSIDENAVKIVEVNDPEIVYKENGLFWIETGYDFEEAIDKNNYEDNMYHDEEDVDLEEQFDAVFDTSKKAWKKAFEYLRILFKRKSFQGTKLYYQIPNEGFRGYAYPEEHDLTTYSNTKDNINRAEASLDALPDDYVVRFEDLAWR